TGHPAYTGEWHIRDFQGFGPFCYRAGEGQPQLVVPALGPCEVIVSGGKEGGKIHIADEYSGYEASPELMPEGEQGNVLQLAMPAVTAYRPLALTVLTPGVCFFGIRCREPQPYNPNVRFDWTKLPPP